MTGLIGASLAVGSAVAPTAAEEGRTFTAPPAGPAGGHVIISGDGCSDGPVFASFEFGYPVNRQSGLQEQVDGHPDIYGRWQGRLAIPYGAGVYSIVVECIFNVHDGAFWYAPKRFEAEARPASPVSQGELSDQSVDFGSQLVGTSSQPREVKLANTGTTPLNVTGARLAGADPGAYSLSGNPTCTVQPAQSCIFLLSFRPDRAGTQNATLLIRDDTTAGSAGRSVDLRGVGVAAAGTRSLTASAPQGPPGTRLEVSGGACPVGVVNVEMAPGYPSLTGPSVASATGDGDTEGRWSAPLMVPPTVARGDYSVSAVCRARPKGQAASLRETSIRLVAASEVDVIVEYTAVRFTVTKPTGSSASDTIGGAAEGRPASGAAGASRARPSADSGALPHTGSSTLVLAAIAALAVVLGCYGVWWEDVAASFLRWVGIPGRTDR